MSAIDTAGLAADLTDILGPDAVLARPHELALYEYDATVQTCRPDVVVLPETTQQVVEVVRLAIDHEARFEAKWGASGAQMTVLVDVAHHVHGKQPQYGYGRRVGAVAGKAHQRLVSPIAANAEISYAAVK